MQKNFKSLASSLKLKIRVYMYMANGHPKEKGGKDQY